MRKTLVNYNDPFHMLVRVSGQGVCALVAGMMRGKPCTTLSESKAVVWSLSRRNMCWPGYSCFGCKVRMC